MAVRGVDATYYTVEDLDKLTGFYTGVLGAPPTTTVPERISEWVFSDDTSFGLYRAEGKPRSRSGSIMFGVDDLERALAACKELGVSLEGGDGEVTETPVCRMAFAYDPEGNQFILHQRRS